MAEIERLEINITANADNAIKKIDELREKLGQLNSTNLSGLTNSLSKLAKMAGSISAVFAGILNASKAFNTAFDVKSGLKSQSSVSDLSKSIQSAVKHSESLNRSLTAINDIDLSKITGAMDNLASSTADAAQNSRAFKNSFKASKSKQKDVTQSVESAEIKTEGIQQASAEFGKMVDDASLFQDTMQQIGNSDYESFASLQMHLGQLDAEMQTAAETARTRSAIISKAFSIAKTGIAAFGKACFSAIKNVSKLLSLPFRSFAAKIQNAAKSFTKLGNSISRVIMYRTLRAALKAVTDSIGSGLEALTKYSRSIGSDFAPAMDSLKSSFALMGASIVSAAAPLLSALTPAIQTATSVIIGLINAVNQLLSVLGGKATWTKATSAVTQYGDAASGAAQAAKSLTTGIDELNVLSDSSGSGGGGGSSSTSPAYEFETQAVEAWAQAIKDALDNGYWQEAGSLLAEHLNGLIAAWDAEAWGEDIGKKIQNGIEFAYGFLKDLDTEELGKKIAQFFNNAIKNIDTEKLGKTLAQAWNRVIDFFYGIALWTDWVQLGNKISAFINGAIKDFDATKLGDTIELLVKGLLNAIGTAFDGLDSKELKKKIEDFFTAVDWIGIGETTADNFNKIASKCFEVLKDTIDAFDVDKIFSSIKAFFDNVNWIELGASAGALFNSTVSKMMDVLIGLVRNFPATQLLDSIFSFFKQINFIDLGERTGVLFNETVLKLVEILTKLISEHPIEKVALALTKFVIGAINGIDWGSLGLAVLQLAGTLMRSIYDAIVWGIPAITEAIIYNEDFDTALENQMNSWITTPFKMIRDGWDPAFDLIDEKMKGKQKQADADTQAWLDKTTKEISEKTTAGTDEVNRALGAGMDNIQNTVRGAFAIIQNDSTGAWEYIAVQTNEKLVPIYDEVDKTWKEVTESTAKHYKSVKETVGTELGQAEKDASTHVQNIKDGQVKSWSDLADTTEKEWKALKTSVESVWKGLEVSSQTVFGNMQKNISQAWKDMLTGASNSATTMQADIVKKWEEIRKSAEDIFTKDIPKTVKDAWDTINKDTTTIWGQITTTLETKWKDLSKKAETEFKTSIPRTIEEAWKSIKTKTTNTWIELENELKKKWKDINNDAKDILGTTLVSTIKTAWFAISEDVKKYWSEASGIPFDLTEACKKILTAFTDNFSGPNGARTIVSNAFSEMAKDIDTSTGKAYESINTFVTNSINRLNDLINKMNETNEAGNAGGMDIDVSLNEFATGGFPTTGSLFIAREAGPEMVGSIGGRTAVANNDQIVSAVAEGVYSAVLSAMSQTEKGDTVVNITIDDGAIGRANQRYVDNRGTYVSRGAFANAY